MAEAHDEDSKPIESEITRQAARLRQSADEIAGGRSPTSHMLRDVADIIDFTVSEPLPSRVVHLVDPTGRWVHETSSPALAAVWHMLLERFPEEYAGWSVLGGE